MQLTGEVMKFIRFTKGIDQRTLATLTGVAQCTVSKFERGVLNLSPLTAKRFMQALQLSEADIMHAKNHIQMLNRFK